MKNRDLIVYFLLLITFSIQAQNFEGKIIYSNKYISKIQGLSDDKLGTMFGTQQEFFIKDGNYKSILNGNYLQWQLYINNENKIYNKFSTSPNALWDDCSVSDDVVFALTVNKNAIEILGRKCDEYVYTCKSGIQRYYFDNSIKISEVFFKNHNYANWNRVVSDSKSLPLKIIIENNQFTFESIAMIIENIKLENEIFQLPLDIITIKSPK